MNVCWPTWNETKLIYVLQWLQLCSLVLQTRSKVVTAQAQRGAFLSEGIYRKKPGVILINWEKEFTSARFSRILAPRKRLGLAIDFQSDRILRQDADRWFTWLFINSPFYSCVLGCQAFYNKVTLSFTSNQRLGNQAHNCKIAHCLSSRSRSQFRLNSRNSVQ